MIVITGANGHLGRQIAENLLQRLPATELAVSVRHPEKADHLAAQGVTVRKADFADPESLAAAFRGAEQLLIVSANKLGDEAVRLHGNAIQAAKAARIQRILYTSHQAASPTSLFVPARTHAATEALLASSGVPFVALRDGFYAESALFQLTGMQQSGTLALPEDGPISWTARADLAEAAAVALADPTALNDGLSPPLTGAEALTFTQIADISSSLLGREVTRETLSDTDFRSALVARGTPAFAADMLVTLYTAARAHEFDIVDPTLERLLGRKPTSLRDVLITWFSQPEHNLFQAH